MSSKSIRTSGESTLSMPAAAWLVAKREILAQVKSKSFIIATVIMILLFLVGSIAGGHFTGQTFQAQPVAVVGQTAPLLAGNSMIESIPADSPEAAVAMVKDGSVKAAVLPSEDTSTDPMGFYIVADKSAPDVLTMSLTQSPRVQVLTPDENSSDFDPFQYIVTMMFAIIFLMSTMTFGSTIAQNTVIEKQTRTVEILLSAIPATALLAGKILGNSILAITQTVLFLTAGAIGLMVTGQHSILSALSASAIWYVVFFVFGFVLVASIYAATASLVSRIEDIASVSAPVMMVVMVPYVLVITLSTNHLVMKIASFFPFTSTLAMPLRMVQGPVPVWEPILSLVILIVTDVLVIMVAAKIYRSSLLKNGPKIKLSEALASAD